MKAKGASPKQCPPGRVPPEAYSVEGDLTVQDDEQEVETQVEREVQQMMMENAGRPEQALTLVRVVLGTCSICTGVGPILLSWST